ncbi:hypothetical protein WJX81_003220 [Elliptochloris bilobata]|uniref:Expansin n=1 Tax=Elliptochloris bilobata TaxID=381761 RepID=A0AAW1RJX8_9CHLO
MPIAGRIYRRSGVRGQQGCCQSFCKMLSKVLFALCAAALVATASAGYNWASVLNSNKLQYGDGTFYGQQSDQDERGTCSFGSNFANTMHLPWSNGTHNTVALNDNMFSDSLPCGTCIMYRGVGQGIGTTPIPQNWTRAIVNNRCPECSFGDIDLNLNGDGRWKVQWHAMPCNVGDSKLHYSIVVSTYYWFSLVVSNTRIPVSQVEVKINNVWIKMQRANNNQWPYYNTNGPWQTGFPMPVRVTSIAGETVEDTIAGPSGGEGHVQFSADRIVPQENLAEAVAGGWDYGSSPASSSSNATAPSPSSSSAPAPAPQVAMPAPTAASARATPTNEQYAAVGGRRLLSSRV